MHPFHRRPGRRSGPPRWSVPTPACRALPSRSGCLSNHRDERSFRARRDLVGHRLSLVLRRQAPLRGRARGLRAPRRRPRDLAELRARSGRAARARRRRRRTPGREVRHEPRPGPGHAAEHDRRRRRRRTRVPLRSGSRRQHVRRPPAAAPGRRPRHPGRDEGTPHARVSHRGLSDRRPRRARAAGDRGRRPGACGARPPGRRSIREPRSATTSARPRRSASRPCRSSPSIALLARRARSRRRCSASCFAAPGRRGRRSRSSPTARPAAQDGC